MGGVADGRGGRWATGGGDGGCKHGAARSPTRGGKEEEERGEMVERVEGQGEGEDDSRRNDARKRA